VAWYFAIVSIEKSTIETAIRNSPDNLGDAARALGCSRRTLTNRMRTYGMAYGKSGRRKRYLPYERRLRGATVVLGAAAALALGYIATKTTSA